jgi:hypothetical protein
MCKKDNVKVNECQKMTNRNISDDWIHKVRIENYEKTKNMSRKEFMEYFTKSGEEVVKKYGLKIVNPLDLKDDKKS